MNRIVIGIVVSVCILGMALIMLNERLSGSKQNLISEQKNVLNQPYTVTTPALKQHMAQTPLPHQTQNSLGPINYSDETAFNVPSLPEPQKPVVINSERSNIRAQANLETRPHIQQPSPVIKKAEPDIHPIAKASENMRMTESEKERSVKTVAQATPTQVRSENKPETKVDLTKKEPALKETKTNLQAKESKNVKESKESKDLKKEAKKDTKKIAESVKNPEIKKFVVFNRDSGATVRLQGSTPILRYKNLSMHNPERILLDLDGNWKIVAPGVPKNPLVSNVRIGKYPNRTRIVVDLKEKPKNSKIVVAQDRHTIDIRVDQ